MFSLWSLVLGIKAAEALVLNSPQTLSQHNATAGTSLQAAAVEVLWQTNTSTPSLNVSNDILYHCDANLGIGINGDSCYGAVAGTPNFRSTVQYTFGSRGTGVRYDFPLPRCFISQDGTCILRIGRFGTDGSASASLQQLFHGALTVVHHCVEGNNPPPGTLPGSGGFSRELGPDRRLGIAVVKGDPSNIRCYGSADVKTIVSSCQSILDSMAVDGQQRTFGVDAASSVRLPWTTQGADRRCYMTLRSSGPQEISTWSDIWHAAAMITAMCPTQGKKGLKIGLGQRGLLYLEVGALAQPEAEVATS